MITNSIATFFSCSSAVSRFYLSLSLLLFCPLLSWAVPTDLARAPLASDSAPVQTLSGSYDLGGGANDYLSFTDALNSLSTEGISGSVLFNVYPGTYNETLAISAIPGASPESWIEFVSVEPEGEVMISSVGASGTAVVRFTGSSYLRFERISISAIGSAGQRAVIIENDCSNIEFKNGTLRGSGASLATSYAFESRGTVSDSLLLDHLRIVSAADGIHLASTSASGLDTRISNCVIDSVKRGIYLDHQQRCMIEANDIRVNAGSTAEVDGIYIGTQAASDTVSIRNNLIHSIQTSSSRAVGVKVIASAATSLTRIYNNFIYGFANTGGSQIRALDLTSGVCEVYSNSIYINSVAATGGTYCVHHNVANPAVVVKLRNNILFNNQGTGTAYGVFVQLPVGALDSDFNIIHGTGPSYLVGRAAGVDYASVSAWSAATGDDLQSLSGDPGFASETDLHLASTSGLAHQNGTQISYIEDDIDGESRDLPPDRGADEYGFAAPPEDYAILELLNVSQTYPELSNVSFDAVIQNRGSAAQFNVPLRVYYQGIPRSELPVTLLPLETDTVTLSWTTGFAPSSGELRVEAVLPGDPNQEDNSQSTQVSIIGQPLHGEYRLGGQNADFDSFNEALTTLASRGISDTVVLQVASGTYNESIVIPLIPGVAPDRPLVFRKSITTEGPVKLVANTGAAAMVLDSARYTTLDGISVEAVYPVEVALLLDRDASHNTISNSKIKASTPEISTTVAVRVAGGGCYGNRFVGLTVSDGYHGFKLDGSSANPDSGTVVESCTIFNTVRSVLLLRQENCRILQNVISPGYENSTSHSYGIYVASLLTGDSALVEGNIVTGAVGNSNCHGILSASGSGTGLIYNNFVSDLNLSGSGTVYGIQVTSGIGKVYHNSVNLRDLPGTQTVIGLAVDGSSTIMHARNNAVVVNECDNRSYCIKHQNGTLNSDYNIFYSECLSDSFAFALRGIDAFYETLSEWTSLTGLDTNSQFANPGFKGSTDLHVQPYAAVLNGAGDSLFVLSDIDGDLRGNPPDIGADEYHYSIPAADYCVEWLTPPLEQYNSQTEYSIEVVVRNCGSEDQADVPVRLLFNGNLQDELTVSLLAGGADTVSLSWLTPDAELAGGLLSAQCLLYGDQLLQNDQVKADVIIAGQPLSGLYQIGGGTSDFASLEQAIQSLEIRGIAGDVTIELFAGDYYESVSISEIQGTSASAGVMIQPADGDTASVTIRSMTGKAVIELNGVSYLRMSGINLRAEGDCPGALLMKSGSANNYFGRASLIGPDSVKTNSFGASIGIGSCDFNIIDRTLVTGAYRGIDLSSAAATGLQSYGTRIENCRINHARYGIYIDDQVDCMISNNEIIPGSPSSLAAVCYGIFVTHLNDGGTVEISANRIHGFADASGSVSNRAVGIYCAPAAGGIVTAYNNFIYDFSQIQSLKISGIYLSIGTNRIYNNSILIDDSPSSSEISGILIFAGEDNDIRNNIVVSKESHVVSFGIYALGGSADISDYNNLWGVSPQFKVGRIGSVEYTDLNTWHATGYDPHSVSLDPHFMSDADLHIDPIDDSFDDLGDPAVPVSTDIDDAMRNNPPDIGADEFSHLVNPEPPSDLTVSIEGDSTRLRWLPSDGALHYLVYAVNSLDFYPDSLTLIGTSVDTFYVEPVSPSETRFYIVKASSE